jgi:hypothetical protein
MKNIFKISAFALVAVIGMTVVGCDKGTPDEIKTIDPKFRGKWEVNKIVLQGTTYTIPSTISGTQFNSFGYEIGETYFTIYRNGVVNQMITDVHTEGNGTLVETSNNHSLGTFKVAGNNLEYAYSQGEETAYAVRVSQFSWE